MPREQGQFTDSECVEALYFEPENGTLTVVFKQRGTYEYYDFPLEEWELFDGTTSRGTYFNLYVKGQYSYARVG